MLRSIQTVDRIQTVRIPAVQGRRRGTRSRHGGSPPSVVALLLAVTLAGACATNPVTGRREFAFLTEDQEIALGQQSDVEIRQQMGLYDDDRLQAYVEDIGLSLAAVSHRPDLPWQFSVVDSAAVNAFALPGGYIYVTRGIMAYLPDEAALAGVLGHEVGHVTARHSVQAYTRSTGAQLGMIAGQVFVPGMRNGPGLADAAGSGLGVLFLKFGRDAEIQADRLGAEYSASAGWHPDGVSDMLSTLGRISEGTDRRGVPNWMSTHPEPAARVADIAPTISRLVAETDTQWRVNRGRYLEHIDGLRFGDNPEDGIVRGNEFIHPVMRFSITFPEGWEVLNTPQAVVARQPGTDMYMLLQLAERAATESLSDVAERAMDGSGYVLVSGGDTEIGQLNAYVATYRRASDQGDAVVARVAYVASRETTYAFGGVGPEDSFDRVETDVSASIRSFRELTRREAASIRPNEVALYTAEAGDTWQAIAQRRAGDIVSARTLAIMNGYPVDEQPRAGDLLRIVVEGPSLTE